MAKKICLSAITILVIAVLMPFDAMASRMSVYSQSMVPRPRLMSPSGETVDLRGKEELVFLWDPHVGNRVYRRYYDFRLYKGDQMLETGLILKEHLDRNMYRFALSSDMFEDGETYTWSLRQKYLDGARSNRSFYSFKVVK